MKNQESRDFIVNEKLFVFTRVKILYNLSKKRVLKSGIMRGFEILFK